MAQNWKMVLFWVLGTICILVGSMISGHLEKDIGVSDVSYLVALVVSFILFLFGGLLWISVGLAVKMASER